jgi:hypothetical protein
MAMDEDKMLKIVRAGLEDLCDGIEKAWYHRNLDMLFFIDEKGIGPEAWDIAIAITGDRKRELDATYDIKLMVEECIEAHYYGIGLRLVRWPVELTNGKLVEEIARKALNTLELFARD